MMQMNQQPNPEDIMAQQELYEVIKHQQKLAQRQ